VNQALIHESIRAGARAEFSRSGGPGGQNVNKVNTKVTLHLALDELAGLNDAEAARLRETLAGRLTASGELVIAASEERSQRVNLERAYARAEALITASARLPRARRATKPTRASRERRLETKKRRAEIKAQRHRPPSD
jgi:ribosome-associated protein